MSEKAACPGCDAYLSEIYYDGRCTNCGWNCRVEYTLRTGGPGAEIEVRMTEKPTEDDRARVRAAAEALDLDAPEVSVSVTVDGFAPRHLNAWLDPDKPTPKPPPAKKRRENLAALREKLIAHEIDARFPDA